MKDMSSITGKVLSKPRLIYHALIRIPMARELRTKQTVFSPILSRDKRVIIPLIARIPTPISRV